LNFNCETILFIFLFPFLPEKHFPKEKTEKKKAASQCGHGEKPKGNGISPEGWIGEARANPLCRSLLVGPVRWRPHYLSCLFSRFALEKAK
jgi:hypothetical protein